jgi:hypothetical protein
MRNLLGSVFLAAAFSLASGIYFSEIEVQAVRHNSADGESFSFLESAQAKCDTEAYLQDNDPAGTNVRSKPDRNSSVLKILKTEDEVVVHISGDAGNGWFEIDHAVTVGGEQDLTIFEGRGWVHSSVLGLSVGSGDARLYSAPAKRSRVIKRLIPDQSPITMLGCRGTWMKVRTGRSVGWMSPESQCANPLTTCA